MDNDELIDLLNGLLETTRDGEQGFARCGERAQDAALEGFMARRAAECAHAASDLQRMVLQCGGVAEDAGSMAGSLHRGWALLRGRIAADGDQALLKECLRGQDGAAQRYRDALAEPLPALFRLALQQQYEGLCRNRERVRVRVRARCAPAEALPMQG